MCRKGKTSKMHTFGIALVSLPFLSLPSRLPGALGGSESISTPEQIMVNMKMNGKATDLIADIEAIDRAYGEDRLTPAMRTRARKLQTKIGSRGDLSDMERGALLKVLKSDLE